jgi:hypothetical protein
MYVRLILEVDVDGVFLWCMDPCKILKDSDPEVDGVVLDFIVQPW